MKCVNISYVMSVQAMRKMLLSALKRISWVTVGLVYALTTPKFVWAVAPAPQFVECREASEASLQEELRKVTSLAIQIDRNRLYQLVDARWDASTIEESIDRAVDDAILEVSSQEDYLSRLWSTWSPDKARELAARVAEATFSSPTFKSTLSLFAEHISEDIADEVKEVSEQSASVAIRCMHSFIGERYTQSISILFDSTIRDGLTGTNFQFNKDEVAPAYGGRRGLTGVGVVAGAYLTRRLVGRLTARLTQRIAGRIAGRALGKGAASFLPVVGWVLGAGLIVWDFVEGGQGVFPQISEALKSDEAKESIRAQVVEASYEELQSELPELARSISQELFNSWQKLKRQIHTLLELAESSSEFSVLLKHTPPNQIERLADQVDIVRHVLGRDGLNSTIRDGRFQNLLALPSSAIEILRITRSLDDVFAWAELAGANLNKVKELEVYRYLSPSHLTRAELQIIIGIDDRRTIGHLLTLELAELAPLLDLSSTQLQEFGRLYTREQLRLMSSYMRTLPEEYKNLFIQLILEDPMKIDFLKSETLRRQLLNNKNIEKNLRFLFGEISMAAAWSDVQLLGEGSVSYEMVWAKYSRVLPWGVGGVLISLLLLFIRRR